ncbi:hypothetical protein [Ligilactobacillus murinus]|uniref:hypothetical protein n=1 Tax=Ligilactobacillus murinus TaxID=1622 RepID=UPI00178402DE|nr:hypothetical protein [Ligilactobacillus murinus]
MFSFEILCALLSLTLEAEVLSDPELKISFVSLLDVVLSEVSLFIFSESDIEELRLVEVEADIESDSEVETSSETEAEFETLVVSEELVLSSVTVSALASISA